MLEAKILLGLQQIPIVFDDRVQNQIIHALSLEKFNNHTRVGLNLQHIHGHSFRQANTNPQGSEFGLGNSGNTQIHDKTQDPLTFFIA